MTYISFALVGEKNPCHDRKDYLICKLNKLKEEKTLNFERIIKDNKHENSCKEYCYECNYEQYKCEIYFSDEEYENIQHLYVQIRAEESSNEQEEWIEQVKLSLKRVLRRDWERLFWFRDTASAKLSKELYPVVYDVENLLRQLIYEVVIKVFGLQWWGNYITYNIDAKYKSRNISFKKIATSFNDIDDKLLSIDVNDLKEILYFKIYKWEPAYDVEIERMICNQSKPKSLDSIMDKLKKQCSLVCNLWDEYFSRCIQSESAFEKILDNYIMHRNHIAHNKLLDRKAFERIKYGCGKISEILNKAIDKIPQIILSKEEQIVRQEIQREIWEDTVKEGNKQLIEAESGVSSLDEGEIRKKYDEVLEIIFDRIEMELGYRSDLEYSTYKSILNLDLTENPVFIVTHKVTEDVVEVYCSLLIDDSPSGVSSATLLFKKKDDDGGHEIELHYINGEAQFDDESGTYMPVTADEMQWPDDVVDEGASYIDDVLKNLRREVDGNRYYRVKNGEMSPCAEFPCEECGTGYICIDESLAPIGTCLNCGAKHEIAKCGRCGEYFEGTDDDFFCENCQERIDRE